MAIPFYEPNNQEAIANHQQQSNQQSLPLLEEGDQVDGPIMTSPPNNALNASSTSWPPPPPTQNDLMAWKILALTMCKALKDHYQQTMATAAPNNSSTAVIQILPNGQVKPSWN